MNLIKIMKEIKLLDCTLSSIRCLYDYGLGEKTVSSIIELLEKSDIDIIDLGLLENDDNSVLNKTTTNVKAVNSKVQYSITIDMDSPVLIDKILPYKTGLPNIIRVVFSKKAIKCCFDYCKKIDEKGYKICILPAQITQYSEQEFIEMLNLFNPLTPFAMYIYDSIGEGDQTQMLSYFTFADKYLNTDVAIGYHGYNNKLQALEIAKSFITQNLDRTLIIDGSLYGISKGSGTLNTELIADYMNEKNDTKYELLSLIKASSTYIVPLKKKYSWGYAPEQLLSVIYACDSDYSDYYINRLHLTTDDTNNILSMLSAEDKISFSQDKAKDYFKDYRKSKLDLAIIIPTYDEAYAVESWLKNSIKDLWYYGIDIIIFDSSPNFETEAIVKNYKYDGYDNIIYYRYKDSFEEYPLNDMILAAYKKYSTEYEFLWICSTAKIINIKNIYEKLCYISCKKNDCILLNDSKDKSDDEFEKIYNFPQDAEICFKENFKETIDIGAIIISSLFVTVLLDKTPKEKSYYPMWYPFAIYHYFSSYKSIGSLYVDDIFSDNRVKSLKAGLDIYGNQIEQWGDYFPRLFDMLPAIYDSSKQYVLNQVKANNKHLSAFVFMKSRANGQMSLKQVIRYRKYLSRLSNIPLWQVYVIALMPKYFAKHLIHNRKTNNIYQFFLKKD